MYILGYYLLEDSNGFGKKLRNDLAHIGFSTHNDYHFQNFLLLFSLLFSVISSLVLFEE